MSGPKKSSYEIQKEILYKRKAEAMAKKDMQVKKIRFELNELHNSLIDLETKYGALSNSVKSKIKGWMSEVESNISGDLRECYRGIKGIKNYLEKQKSILAKRKEEIRERQLKEQLREQQLEEEKMLKEAKINSIIQSLAELRSDYSEIMNEGIEQRIELFQKSIKLNPDNQNTINQIDQFKDKLYELYEEHMEKKENTKYVADVFANILKGNMEEYGKEILVSGSIDGVPILVKLNQNNNEIDFDTPIDGSCKKVMETIQNELKSANINLGETKVLKTGQILNRKNTTINKGRIKA